MPRILPHDDEDKIIPEFTITISNAGDGKTFPPNGCEKQTTRQEADTLLLTATLSGQKLTCTPAPFVLRIQGDNTAVCRLEPGIEISKGTYNAPLTIQLSYAYSSTKVQQIVIKKP